MQKRKILIAGGGISGLTAAINLVRAGHQVDVFERNKDCGMRYHEDFQGIANWTTKKDALTELQEMGIRLDFNYRPFTEMYLAGADLKKVYVVSKRPNYYLVKRGVGKETLDQSMKRQALTEGVKIHFNSTFPEEDADIIATGNRGADAVGQGIKFKTDARDIALTIMDKDLAPGGYAYLFIVDGEGLIMTWYYRKFKHSQGLLDKTIKAFDKIHPMARSNVRRVGGGVSFFLMGRYTRGKQKLVGERAGLQDYFGSFGIRSSITSGYLAARSIIDDTDYDSLIKARYKRMMDATIVSRYIWERMSNRAFIRFIKRAGKNKDTNPLLYRLSGPSWWKSLLLPLAKWSMKGKNRYDPQVIWARSQMQQKN